MSFTEEMSPRGYVSLTREQSQKNTHKQCRLTQDKLEYLCWVPNDLAVTGKYVSLDGKIPVWQISEVFDNVNKELMRYMLKYNPKTLKGKEGKLYLEEFDPRRNYFDC